MIYRYRLLVIYKTRSWCGIDANRHFDGQAVSVELYTISLRFLDLTHLVPGGPEWGTSAVPCETSYSDISYFSIIYLDHCQDCQRRSRGGP